MKMSKKPRSLSKIEIYPQYQRLLCAPARNATNETTPAYRTQSGRAYE
jgi:hypothetical protein